jgi:hypothetical protein
MALGVGLGGRASAALSQSPAQNVPGIEGIWQGILEVPGQSLRLVAHIARKADGTFEATVDSPDQDAKGIPVAQTTFAGGTLKLAISAVSASFEGKLSADGKQIAGTFKQGGASLPLTLKRVDRAPEVAARRRPQEPKRPYPYDEREVSYENKAGGVKLAGTLTLPRGQGPFPAVLLITGSGPQDRDEAVFGHRPFLILSDYLTRRGIAVLRVDDRGVGGSTGHNDQSTTMDFVGDVLTGVAFLKAQKEIDLHRVGLIGHSEGGIIAPMAASRSNDVAFIVMMAGTGLTGEQILYLQGERIGQAQGSPAVRLASERSLQERMFTIVKQEKDPAVAKKRLHDALAETFRKMSSTEKKAIGDNPEAWISAQTEAVLSPWFRYFLTLDPRHYLEKVRCPVLAINGEFDLQVPPKENLPAIEKALKAAGNKDYTIRELPGLNHLFQTCTAATSIHYTQIEETLSPLALQTIGDWIEKHTGP